MSNCKLNHQSNQLLGKPLVSGVVLHATIFSSSSLAECSIMLRPLWSSLARILPDTLPQAMPRQHGVLRQYFAPGFSWLGGLVIHDVHNARRGMAGVPSK